jgi:hypothetical protein
MTSITTVSPPKDLLIRFFNISVAPLLALSARIVRFSPFFNHKKAVVLCTEAQSTTACL